MSWSSSEAFIARLESHLLHTSAYMTNLSSKRYITLINNFGLLRHIEDIGVIIALLQMLDTG